MIPPHPKPSSPAPGAVCLVSTTEHRYFQNPIEIYSTSDIDEVYPLLEALDARVQSENLYAAGYLSYEAAKAFDEALVTHVSTNASTPLLWFGLYASIADVLPDVDTASTADAALEWTPGITKQDFDASIATIREHIAAGDTYQVNYTFPLHTQFSGDAYAWFRRLCASQRGDYCAYINTGEQVVMSISPELFFTLDGNRLSTKPMKGTIARGLTTEQDEVQRATLQDSVKDRAENLMIVDLVRNDMGRISETSTVEVESLFDVNPFDRLWQMTSTINAQSQATLPEIFKALFPCGSVTGAPKIITSRLIRDLEPKPRGAYCGAIGYWDAHRQATFNVAIRTATLDVASQRLVYPVGAGITWDSSADAEYEECLLKAAVVTHPKPVFELLESLLWDSDYFLLDRHINRLMASAQYFGFSYDEAKIRAQLSEAQPSTEQSYKVRLLLHRDGAIHIESAPIEALDSQAISLATQAVDSQDVFLHHKTTHRDVYSDAVKDALTKDVLLWNERDEITESTIANVVVQLNGIWYTPPIASGLLAGTFRAALLASGEIQEKIITKSDLIQAESIKLINSVRKWIEVDFIP